MRPTRIVVLFALAGVALLAIGIVVGGPAVTIEGAYFMRASGRPAFSDVLQMSSTGPGSPYDGNLWIGAGLACCVVAVVAARACSIARRSAAGD